MPDLLIFDSAVLDRLSDEAKASARRRKNLNLHPSPEFPPHRFLNAMEPDSYGQPHRHPELAKDETLVVLRGRFGLLVFDAQGRVTRKAVLGAGGEALGVNIPAGTLHSLISLESGSVFMEAKAGPYDASTDKETPAWAPPEGSAEASTYFAKLRELFT